VQLIVVYDVPSTAAPGGDGDAAENSQQHQQLRQRPAVMHPDSLQATGPYSQVRFNAPTQPPIQCRI